MKVNKGKIIKKNPHLFIKLTKDKISFRNLKDGQSWQFSKIGDYASKAHIIGHQVSFGFPKVTQVIYPGQTVRLNSGWQLEDMPTDTMMHTYPSNALIQSNMIAIPQSIDASKAGGELVQVLMNNSNHPIQIALSQQNEDQVEVFQLDSNTLQKNLKFDFGQLLKTGLGIASQVLPFFA